MKTLVLLLIAPLLLQACAGSHHARKPVRHNRYGVHAVPKSDIPLVVNERVVAWVDYFTGANRERFARYLKRSGRYTPQMRQILKSYGMPQDLIYLSMIESGFVVRARSHASAVGLWQFIRATGNRYGLDQDMWIEERQDPEKSTHAAAQYLRDLYNEFGDWYLAMAGYNAGEGTVRRAIARHGSKDFWDLSEPRKGAFRAETRDYVPKFIAAAIIAKNPEKFGFDQVEIDAPIDYEVTTVTSPADIDVLARCAGVDQELLADLNAELKLGTAPTDYKLKLPIGTAKKFHVALARIPVDERIKATAIVQRHEVGKHENLKAIARRYGVSPSSILAANDLRNAKSLRRGMTLTIPIPNPKASLLAKAGRGSKLAQPVAVLEETQEVVQKAVKPVSTPPAIVATTNSGYVVTEGDSWNSISKSLNIPTKQLKTLNADVAKNGLHVGDVLWISPRSQEVADASASQPADVPEVVVDSTAEVLLAPVVTKAPKKTSTAYHKVRAGDTLDEIARQYQVNVSDLKAWNQLKGSHIRSGQKLKVTGQLGRTDEAPRVTKPQNVTEKAKTNKVVRYKVRPGDNLWTIGKKHKVSPDQIKNWNALKTGVLKPGDVITLRQDS